LSSLFEGNGSGIGAPRIGGEYVMSSSSSEGHGADEITNEAETPYSMVGVKVTIATKNIRSTLWLESRLGVDVVLRSSHT